MRIGIDGRFWDETGVGRYIRNLVSELSKRNTNHEFVLFVGARTDVTQKSLGKQWTIVRTDIRWHSFDEQLFYPKILQSHNLDLIHFPYFSIPLFVNIPSVVTIHDLILHHFSTGKASTLPLPIYYAKRQAYKYVLSQAAQKAKHIIAVSSATKKEILDHLPVLPSKITVTYEGVDASFSSKKSKKDSERFFLYVGNAYPHKNLEMMFYAFSQLEDTKVKLYVVGKNDYFGEEMKKVAYKTYKNPNIVFKTDVSDTELSSLYANALALIAPSLMEGFGLPALEAMNAKCLVIASRIPSFEEVCEDTVLYFDPYSAESLTKQLSTVLTKKETLHSKIESAYKRSQVFSWKKMAEETLAVYEKALSN